MAPEHGETTVDHAELRMLYEALEDWTSYPSNLAHPTDRPKFVEDVKRRFGRTKHNVLLVLDKSTRGARRKAIERKIRTVWFDSVIGTPHDSSRTEKPDIHERRVSNNADLDDLFGINSSQSKISDRSPAGKGKTFDQFQPSEDPVCRIIILESSAPVGRRLNITEEMLLKILTYHQVSPHFLNFISHICHEPPTGVSEVPFGGFRSLKSFPEPSVDCINALDRSGTHYQLVFDLRTVFNPRDLDDESTEATTTEDLDIWPISQCAIYHHFDVSNGKSLWIITAADAETRSQFRNTKDVNKLLSTTVGASSSSPTTQRFKSSLSVLVSLGDWLLSEYDYYIATLNEQMQNLAMPYISEKENFAIAEITLKMFNGYMEALDQCMIALEANVRVCKALLKFYGSDLFQDEKLHALPWWTESRAEVYEHVRQFKVDMQSICDSLEEMLRRAGVVKQMGTRRENTIHRVLQNRDTSTMKELAKLTYIFSTITLLLLPMSVVSTIFSTDIVQFQDGVGGFAGNWSGPAAVWWAVATIIATSLVGWVGERWRRKSAMASRGRVGNTASSITFNKPGVQLGKKIQRTYHNAVDRSRFWTRRFKVRVYGRIIGLLKTDSNVTRANTFPGQSRRDPRSPPASPPQDHLSTVHVVDEEQNGRLPLSIQPQQQQQQQQDERRDNYESNKSFEKGSLMELGEVIRSSKEVVRKLEPDELG